MSFSSHHFHIFSHCTFLGHFVPLHTDVSVHRKKFHIYIANKMKVFCHFCTSGFKLCFLKQDYIIWHSYCPKLMYNMIYYYQTSGLLGSCYLDPWHWWMVLKNESHYTDMIRFWKSKKLDHTVLSHQSLSNMHNFINLFTS